MLGAHSNPGSVQAPGEPPPLVDREPNGPDAAALRAENRALRQLSLVQERLVEQVMAGADTPAIVRALALTIGKPVELVCAESWSPTTSAEPTLPGATGAPTIAVPIRSRGSLVGHLVVPSGTETATLADRLILDCAARLIALIWRRDRGQVERVRLARGQILVDLLAGAIHEEQELIARGTTLGCDLSSRCCLLVAEVRDDAVSEEIAGAVAGALGERPALAAIWEGRIVVLVPEDPTSAQETERTAKRSGPDAEALAEWIRAGLDGPSPRLSASIVLSPEGIRAPDAPRWYAEAVAALTIASQLGRTGEVLRTNDRELRLFRFLVAGNDTAAIRRFIGDALDELEAYDARRRAQLVQTLEAYLNHNGNLAATAGTCAVHVNTLKYRLGKIAEISGLALHDPTDRLHAQVALKLRRFVSGPVRRP